MGTDGFQQGGPYTDNFKIGSRQPQSHLPGRENSNNSPPYGRMETPDEFTRGRETGQCGSVHLRA